MTVLTNMFGVGAGGEVLTFGAPRAVITRFQSECPGVNFKSKPLAGVYSAQPSVSIGGFCFLTSELSRALPAFKRLLAQGGVLWIFWPKPQAWHAEGIRPEMGVTIEAVQSLAANLGLAHVDSAEVDEVWTAAKFVTQV